MEALATVDAPGAIALDPGAVGSAVLNSEGVSTLLQAHKARSMARSRMDASTRFMFSSVLFPGDREYFPIGGIAEP